MMFTEEMMNRNLLGDEINRIYNGTENFHRICRHYSAECLQTLMLNQFVFQSSFRLHKVSAMAFNAYQYFDCKPSVTNTLDVEEEHVRIRFFLIYEPP